MITKMGKLLKKISISGTPPKIQPFSISDHLTEGSETKIGCMVTKGDGPLQFKWYKDQSEIKNDSEFEINSLKEVSFLTVKRLSGYNSGNITCHVQNAYGRDSYSVVLVVEGTYKMFVFITYPLMKDNIMLRRLLFK